MRGDTAGSPPPTRRRLSQLGKGSATQESPAEACTFLSPRSCAWMCLSLAGPRTELELGAGGAGGCGDREAARSLRGGRHVGKGISSTVTGGDQAEAECSPAQGCQRHKAKSQCILNACCIQQALAPTVLGPCLFVFNLFIFACVGSLLLWRLFSRYGEWGLLSRGSAQASD